MHILVYHHSVCLGRQTGAHRTDVVLGIIGHDIVGCNEGRHITTCLLGEIGVNLPIILFAIVATDGLVDILRTAIVGCNHQVPVAKNFVKVAEIACSSIRCLDRVATFVNQRVDLQSILFARSYHKLPKTSSTSARDSLGIQGRLDDRQVFQFKRKLIGFQGFFENGNIEIGSAQHVADGVTKASAITVDELLYHVVVNHLHDIGKAQQTADIFLLGIDRIDVAHVTVFLFQIGLGHIEVQQTIQIVGHGFRKFNYFLTTLVVCYSNLVFIIVLVFIVIHLG